MTPRRRAWTIVVGIALAFAWARLPNAESAEARSNVFDDPFVQATRQLANCPVPEGPLYTAAEAKAQSHIRIEKGTTCYLWGRCRLPNAYLYDKDIVARVARFMGRDERFASTSVWIVGQRRWVYLKGCVESDAQRLQLEAEVRLIDDVEAVVDELMVGNAGRPPYATAQASGVPDRATGSDRRPPGPASSR